MTQINADYEFSLRGLPAADLSMPAEKGFAKAGDDNIRI
jgi:hypothetical protein